MQFYNEYSKEKFDKEDITKLLIVSSPILPHITEEIWSKTIGSNSSAHDQQWPEVDLTTLEEETIEIPVQINGKVRGRVEVSKSDDQEQVKSKIYEQNTLSSQLSGKDIKKFIYVPSRIVSITV